MVSAGVRLPGTSRKQGKGGTTVTEKELRKLNRAELLEMLIAQSKRLSRVEEELSAAQKELERRKIAITTSGSLAEAALKLNGIFEAADQAAAQYLDSLREQESNAERIIAEAEAKAHEIINAAEVQRQAILADADREAKRRIELFDQQFKEFLNCWSKSSAPWSPARPMASIPIGCWCADTGSNLRICAPLGLYRMHLSSIG